MALLAAGGRRNKEIAAELFLSVGTIERHLTSAYRQLGVRSRTELAGRFSKKEREGVPNEVGVSGFRSRGPRSIASAGWDGHRHSRRSKGAAR